MAQEAASLPSTVGVLRRMVPGPFFGSSGCHHVGASPHFLKFRLNPSLAGWFLKSCHCWDLFLHLSCGDDDIHLVVSLGGSTVAHKSAWGGSWNLGSEATEGVGQMLLGNIE